MKQPKPTHYLVVRSPYAEALVLGIKTFEWRTWGERLAHKTVAIAVAKAKCPAGAEDEEADKWDANAKETKALKALVAANATGQIIGQVTFGEADDEGVTVTASKIWEKKDWLPSPGGLGLRPLPH